ncbi:MAG: ATP-binding protein [Acidobacteriota bacterium]
MINCKICNDSGWEKIEKDGRESLRKCKCQQYKSFIKRCEKSNIPPKFIGSELSGLIVAENNKNLALVIKRMNNFVSDYPGVQDGILLQGNTGVGKTRILCSIASEIIKKSHLSDLYYIDWNDMVREMKSGESHTFRDFSLINETITRMTQTNLLIMDELGASTPSQWVSDNIYYVLNYRYNRKKITLFASNYLDETSDGSPTLRDRIGDRIRSRIYEMAKPSRLYGLDYRQDEGKASY